MIIPSTKYPAGTTVDVTNFPSGKARNVSASGDGTGFPLEKDWINDWLGFQQAAAAHAGITPSGNSDTAVASQLLDAMSAAKWVGVYAITTGGAVALGSKFGLTQSSQYGGFSVSTDLIQVPVAGKYRAVLSGIAKGSGTANPSAIYVALQGGAVAIDVLVYRPTASASDFVMLNADYVFTIANPATEKIQLLANSTGQTLQFAGNPQLTVERVG